MVLAGLELGLGLGLPGLGCWADRKLVAGWYWARVARKKFCRGQLGWAGLGWAGLGWRGLARAPLHRIAFRQGRVPERAGKEGYKKNSVFLRPASLGLARAPLHPCWGGPWEGRGGEGREQGAMGAGRRS